MLCRPSFVLFCVRFALSFLYTFFGKLFPTFRLFRDDSGSRDLNRAVWKVMCDVYRYCRCTMGGCMYNIRAPVNDLLIITPQSTCIRPRSKSLEPKRQSNLKKKKKNPNLVPSLIHQPLQIFHLSAGRFGFTRSTKDRERLELNPDY